MFVGQMRRSSRRLVDKSFRKVMTLRRSEHGESSGDIFKNVGLPFLIAGVIFLHLEYNVADGRYFGQHNLQHERHGYGVYKYTRGLHSGDIYVGDYKHNLRDGLGLLRYSNGDTYEGEFQNNEKHGKGRMVCANGIIQDGEWVHNKYVTKWQFDTWSD